MVTSLWAQRKDEYTLKDILDIFNLKRPTYYDELHHPRYRHDKYVETKKDIKRIYHNSLETFGYRRIQPRLAARGVHLCLETVRKLTRQLKIRVDLYSKHTAEKYHSYVKGMHGKAPNLLHQNFKEKRPFHVLHTDVTQVKLTNGKWVYISSIEDEASKEILGLTTSFSPKMPLIYRMINQIIKKIPKGMHPIIHSDQGWQYQMKPYHRLLKKLGYRQSMSRKGMCHDNAPAESLFSLMKREFLNRHVFHTLAELRRGLHKYVCWFNHIRISLKTKGLSPVAYRNQILGLN